MPTNANTFNSRVTSEALEAKFREVFPAQGGAELVQDLYASGVITPVIDFSSVAEGSVLAPNLQTAWDFATGHASLAGSSSSIITTTGFWKIDLNCAYSATSTASASISITDGLSSKIIYELNITPVANAVAFVDQNEFVVFVRAGDSVVAQTSLGGMKMDVVYRQIADVYGNLVNPLGYTSS